MLNVLTRTALLAAVLMTTGGAYAADAPSPLRRTELQRSPLPGTNHVVITAQVEIDPAGKIALHTHPGVEVGYALAGTLILTVQGQAERTVRAGESFLIPANTPHGVVGGSTLYKGVHSYIVEADKPISIPVP